MRKWSRFSDLPVLFLFVIMAICTVVYGETGSARDADTPFKFQSFIGLDHGGWGMTWSPDNRHIATNDFFSGTTIIFDTKTGELVSRSEPIGPGSSVAWSDDGRLLARTNAFKLFVLDATSQNLTLKRELHRDAVGCLSFKTERSVEFTADSEFVWATCNWLGGLAGR